MFHLMLVLPVLLPIFAAYAFVLLIPFWVGGALQLVLSICCRRWYFISIPGFLGVAGAAITAVLLYESAGIFSVLVFWVIYLVFISLIGLAVYAIKRAIKKKINNQVKKSVEDARKTEAGPHHD